MDRRRELGDRGERAAEAELARQGSLTIDRNARTRWGEIDLVCRDGRGLVFVEVKTRRRSSFVSPQEAVTAQKTRRLMRLALGWLALHGQRDTPWRLVLAAVTPIGDGHEVELIPIDRA